MRGKIKGIKIDSPASATLIWKINCLKLKNNLLVGAKFIESPNCSERPNQDISLLVIHNISLPPNEFDNDFVEIFPNKLNPNEHPYFKEIENLKVSSHLYIKRDGSIIQFVPFHLKAWHAGVSCFEGQDDCNNFSVGVELEGADDIAYTDEQYESLKEATKALLNQYPLMEKQRIVGHSDIAPSRKNRSWPIFFLEKI